jgi:hypothetical protein
MFDFTQRVTATEDILAGDVFGITVTYTVA